MFDVFVGCTDRATLQQLRSAIEDDVDFRVCGTATTRADVLATAKKCKPNLVILDRDMLPKNGLEAAKELKRNFPKVPIF